MGIANFLRWRKKLSSSEHSELIENFKKLSDDERIRTIMHYGDLSKTEHFPLMRYAVQQDRNQHVQFAALKRLHLFQENKTEAVDILQQLDSDSKADKYEPYLSMAMSRLGIIDLGEYEKRIRKI